ncbi:phosphopantetheine-binding protein [Streptomyces humi]|uniref:phosphopantetheine-binding protein n=1 Tax=Streptomyces humi TaxID=1428620 RepID=UPI00062883C9|nr:phosphopantetheine-binding protein [Streptomyces humi]
MSDRQLSAPAPGPTPSGLPAEISAIWADVLEVDSVAGDLSFYDFGGTSLQAMRICARIERLTGREVAPELLFDADTFEDFVADVLRADDGTER